MFGAATHRPVANCHCPGVATQQSHCPIVHLRRLEPSPLESFPSARFPATFTWFDVSRLIIVLALITISMQFLQESVTLGLKVFDQGEGIRHCPISVLNSASIQIRAIVTFKTAA